MQQQLAPSQEEGVPPAAATTASTAQGNVAEPPPPAPTPTAAAADDDDDDAPPAAPLLAPAMMPPMPATVPLGLGDIEEVDVLLRICGLLVPKDLGRLACVSASFGRKTAWPHSAGELRSVVEETARLWMAARPAEEQARVKHWTNESWLRRMQVIVAPPPRRWWCDPPIPMRSHLRRRPPLAVPLSELVAQTPDEALAVVFCFLGPRELGRLACVARRFTEATLTEPGGGGGGGAGGAQLLSPIEEGARLQLERLPPPPPPPPALMSVTFCTSGPTLFVQWVRRDGSLAPGTAVSCSAPLRMRTMTFHQWAVSDAEGGEVERIIEIPAFGPRTIDVAAPQLPATRVERLAGETWVRALWRVRYRLKFTSCGPAVVLREEGALPARAQYPPLRLSLYLLHNSRPL
jgi:hypothetical protein